MFSVIIIQDVCLHGDAIVSGDAITAVSILVFQQFLIIDDRIADESVSVKESQRFRVRRI